LFTEGNAFKPSGYMNRNCTPAVSAAAKQFQTSESYTQVQQHLLNLEDDFNNTSLFIS
jgi:hypothetical protein